MIDETIGYFGLPGEDSMKRVLEDMFMGPMTSPSFTSGLRFRWEDSRRRVRVIFNGVTVADSKRVMSELCWAA